MSFFLSSIVLLLTACNEHGWGDGVPQEELDARAALQSTSIALEGFVVSADGQGVSGAGVAVGDLSDTTAQDGSFRIEGLTRANGLLEVDATGYKLERHPVHLLRPADVGTVQIQDVVLESEADRTRMLFAGDVSMGRRFMDPGETAALDEIPEDDPTALIRTGDPETGARFVATWMKPLFETADFRALNFESPVTDTPETPHPDPTKLYTFFSLPETLSFLDELDIGYASLGNNHQFDYLDDGVSDTIAAFEDWRIPFSGVGAETNEAFEPAIIEVDGSSYAFFGMSSVLGNQYTVNFTASETKGGSADLSQDDLVRAAMGDAVDQGYIPVPFLHMGSEYMEMPSSFARGRVDVCVDAGAPFVIASHPHVAQGFGRHDGVTVAYSMGNFAFDQDRLETLLAMLVQVDVDGDEVLAVRGLPVYLEDYRPRPLTGALADRHLRRISMRTHTQSAAVYPFGGEAVVALKTGDLYLSERTSSVSFTIPISGEAVVDLRPHLESYESLSFVRVTDGDGMTVRMGRDILLFGEIEDYDVDEDWLEVSRWDVEADSRFPCVFAPYRGVASLCSTRDGSHYEPSVITFRNRIRVLGDPTGEPEKDLSLFGWVAGDGAGPIELEVEYTASEGERSWGTEIVWTSTERDFEWTQVFEDLSLPADAAAADDRENNPRSVKLRLRHLPPEEGRALASFDDLALISWAEGAADDLDEGVTLDVPHASDFLRIAGEPGSYTLSLVFSSATP